MAPKVWISVQSDFGITMAELGKLSSETDSMLIASTLMALKDIVSVEASSGESQFMTGAVETSSFGTFAISIDDKSKLIMSYVISADKGSTVKEGVVSLVKAVCTNLGKQLTQFGYITHLISSGAQIHRSVLIQSFLNACTVVKLEKNLPNDKRLVRKGINQVIINLFDNKKELLEMYNYILGREWKEDDSKWLLGFLRTDTQEALIRGLSYHVVYQLANEKPLSFLYSPDPRNEHEQIFQLIKEEIVRRISDPSKLIIESLLNESDQNIQKSIKSIPVNNLHSANIILFKEFARKALLRAIKIDPILIFSSPDIQPIRQKFQERLPKLDIPHFGTILIEAITPLTELKIIDYLDVFYTGFIDAMYEVPLSQSAVDILTTFSSYFVDLNKLKKQISKTKKVNKKRKDDINSLIKVDEIVDFNIESIEEAVILTKAAGNAVAQTLAKIIHDQFLISTKNTADVLTEFIDRYLTVGPTIKAISIIVSFLKLLLKLDHDIELIIPSTQDLLIASVIHNEYSIKINDYPVIIQKSGRLFSFEFKEEKYSLSQFYEKLNRFQIIDKDRKELVLDINNLGTGFVKIVNHPDILINSILICIERRIKEAIIPVINQWKNDIEEELNKFQSNFDIEADITSERVDKYIHHFPKNELDQINFGEKVSEILSEFNDQIQSTWDDNITNFWKQIKSEIMRKEKLPKKLSKQIKKSIQNFNKTFDKSEKHTFNQFDSNIKNIDKTIKSIKNKLRGVILPSEPEILAFEYDTPDLLPSKIKVFEELKEIIQGRDGLRQEDLESLALSVSISLFENPPETVFESAYNEVISGKRSNAIKKALNKVKTKRQFETYLKNQGAVYASNIYDGLKFILNHMNKRYIAKDGIVTTDGGQVNLHMGRLPIDKINRLSLIENILNFPEVTYSRETDDWLIIFNLLNLGKEQRDKPTIVTFEDAIRYEIRNNFEIRFDQLFKALRRVSTMIESNAGTNMNNLYEEMKKVIYKY